MPVLPLLQRLGSKLSNSHCPGRGMGHLKQCSHHTEGKRQAGQTLYLGAEGYSLGGSTSAIAVYICRHRMVE